MAIGAVEQKKVNAEIILSLSNLQSQMSTVQGMFRRMSTNIATQNKKGAKDTSAAWVAGFAIISAGAIKVANKVTTAFKDMLQTYATFEQSLANTQSVARASTEELEKMELAARHVGATTRSTASDAANALYYLASAGFTASESIDALEGVNALAIATQSDLARTTETVAVTIRQYGLETSAATDIANVFTAAITNSLATMNKLTKSFEYVGPIAAGLGITVEETTGALQLLYNKGFSGEKAGRGLRSILVDLADSTSVVNRKLGNMGIAFDKVNPATNELADIFDYLRENEVNATNAAAIFGKVSGVQLASLISLASDAEGGINELTEAVTGTNRAFEAMEIQMDTLQGSFDKFKNAEEALKISVGKELSPTLRALIDTATGLLLVINKLPAPLLAAVSILGTIVALVTTLTIAVTSLKLALASAVIAPVIASLGALAVPLTVVAGGIAAVVAGVATLRNINIRDSVSQFGDLAKELGATELEMVAVSKAFKKVDYELHRTSMRGIKDIGELRDVVEELADRHKLTSEQVIEVALANDELMGTTGSLVKELKAQLEAEKALAEHDKYRLALLTSKSATEQAHLNYAKQRRASNAVAIEQAEEQLKIDEATSKVTDDLSTAFKRATELQKLFGDKFDRNAYLTNIFNKSLEMLVNQGLKESSAEIQNFIKLFEDLQDATADVFPEETAKAMSRRFNETITTKFKEIEDAVLREAIGEQKINEALEKKKVLLAIVAEAQANNYTLEGDYLSELLKDNKEYLSILDIITAKKSGEVITSTQEYIDKLNELGKSELELLDIQEKIALSNVERHSEEYEAIVAYFLAVRQGIIQTQKDLSDKEAFDKFKSYFEEITSFATDMLDAITEGVVQSIERQIEALEEGLSDTLDLYDEQEEAKKRSEGVQEETTLERLNRELVEAQATGDAITIKEAEDAVRRQEIHEEFEGKRADATIQANKEIAQLEYEAALANWQNQAFEILSQTALNVVKAYPNPLLMVGASAVGVAQGAVLSQNKPQPPAFESGGIVPGSSYKGDSTRILANAGELILNRAQQTSVVDQMESNNQPIYITINSVLDGKVVATNSAKYYRNGQVKL